MKNTQALSLHVPEPQTRPGDEPDFTRLQLPAAGSVERPDISTPALQMRELAYGLIRVLDGEGRAVGPWNPRVDPETLRRGLKAMLLTRAFDDRMYRPSARARPAST